MLVIVNPRSGIRQGEQVLQQICDPLRDAGIIVEPIITTAAGDATRIAHAADLSRYSLLGLIGGDGTLHEVLNGLFTRTNAAMPTLAVFPGGTGNTVMQHLDCLNARQSVDNVVANRKCAIDIACVEMADRKEYCCNIIGWGAATDINATAERLRWLGTLRYSIATLCHVLKPRTRRVQLVLDGKSTQRELLFAIACNTRTTGRGLLLAPHADIADGMLDFVLARGGGSRLQLLRLFRRVMAGDDLRDELVEHHLVREFELIPEEHSGLNLDGELSGSTPCRVRVLPRALTLFADPKKRAK